MENNIFFVDSMIDNGMITFGGDNPVKGVGIKSPFGLFFQNMANTPEFYKQLASHVDSQIPDHINCIGGLGYEGILLGHEITKLSGRKFVSVVASKSSGKLAGFDGVHPLTGHNMVMIPGIVATGNNTAEGLNLIHEAGGLCNIIHPIFDYGFHLKSAIQHYLKRHLVIRPVVTSELVGSHLQAVGNANGQSILNWISLHNNQFRKDALKEKQLA